jgi:hypothetical protein
MTKMPSFPNTVYSYHFYSPDWDTYGKEHTDLFLNRAKNWDVPIWQGEFVAFNFAETGNAADLAQFVKLMNYQREQNIGWSYYAYMGHPGGLTKNGILKPYGPEALKTLQAGF